MFRPLPGTASLPGRDYYAKCSYSGSLTDRGKPHFSLEASTSNLPIKLQILLRKEWRTSAGIEEVARILASIGLKMTSSGLATISAEAEPERFESLFGVKASEIASRGPSGTDFGTSGGHESADLTVPAQLANYVASISVAPPHTYLED
jgi:hypothetical protein